MEKKKKRHHYVFQGYLKKWATDEQIWCLRENRIFLSNTKNIAQENDFYKLLPINQDEVNLLDRLFYSKFPQDIRESYFQYIRVHNLPFSKGEKLEKIKKKIRTLFSEDVFNFLFKNVFKIIEESLETQKSNNMENYYSRGESNGTVYINHLLNKDSSFYYSNDLWANNKSYQSNRLQFLVFVSTQYHRTKAAKTRSLSGIQPVFDYYLKNEPSAINKKINLENIYPHIAWVVSNLCADYLDSKNASLVILENNTNIPFITCDQPVKKFAR